AAVTRVGEGPQSAVAVLNVLLLPGPREQRTFRLQPVDEGLYLRVAEGVAKVGAEFGEQPARPLAPVRDQDAGTLLKKDEAQQIALMVGVEPADEQARCGGIPGAGVPQAVEAIGRIPDRLDGGCQRRRGAPLRLLRQVRIEPSRQLEQIGALRGRERERSRKASQGLGRGLYGPPLFDPGAPRRTDARPRSQLLPPQTWRATAPAGR